MADRKGDKAKQPPECQPDEWSLNPCPNLTFRQDHDGERYRCDECGVSFWLDYEDMK